MFKQNIAAVLNKQRADKNGLYPLRVRVTIKRTVSYFPTGVMLREDQWVGGEVVNHRNRVLLNAEIRSKISEIEKSHVEQALTGEEVTHKQKYVNLKFCEYAEKKIKQWTGSQAGSTTDHRWSELNKFKEFNSNIKLKDIDNDVLTDYENFCRETKGNIGNTVWTAVKFVKRIVNAGLKDKVIPRKRIVDYEGAKYIDPFRDTLSPDEIARVEKFANNKLNSKKLLNVANWFLFSCYTGLRYGDLNSFRGFNNGKVLLQTEKTKEVVSIFVTGQIKESFERLSDEMISNQKFNDYLKSVAAICDIDKHITCHTARHTFAVQFLERGGRMEILSKLLGHSNIKTTQKYGKISNNLVDAEMKKVWHQPITTEESAKRRGVTTQEEVKVAAANDGPPTPVIKLKYVQVEKARLKERLKKTEHKFA